MRYVVCNRGYKIGARRGSRGTGKVIVGHLQVMLACHLGTVSEPCADHVRRETGVFKLRLPARPQVLKYLWPWGQPSVLDDLFQAPSQVLFRPVAVAVDEELLAGFCLLHNLVPRGRQEGPQFREDRNPAARLALTFRLGTVNEKPVFVPTDIFEAKPEDFGRAAQTAESAKGEDQLPFHVGAGFQDGFRHVQSDEELPVLVGRCTDLQTSERVLSDQPAVPCVLEELLGELDAFLACCVGESVCLGRVAVPHNPGARFQVSLEVLGIGYGDVSKGPVGAKERNQVLLRLMPDVARLRRDVDPPVDVVLHRLAQRQDVRRFRLLDVLPGLRGRFATLPVNQAGGDQPGEQSPGKLGLVRLLLGQPGGRLGIRRRARLDGG